MTLLYYFNNRFSSRFRICVVVGYAKLLCFIVFCLLYLCTFILHVYGPVTKYSQIYFVKKKTKKIVFLIWDIEIQSTINRKKQVRRMPTHELILLIKTHWIYFFNLNLNWVPLRSSCLWQVKYTEPREKASSLKLKKCRTHFRRLWQRQWHTSWPITPKKMRKTK